MEQRYQQQITETYYLTSGSLRLLEAALIQTPALTVHEPVNSSHKCCTSSHAALHNGTPNNL